MKNGFLTTIVSFSMLCVFNAANGQIRGGFHMSGHVGGLHAASHGRVNGSFGAATTGVGSRASARPLAKAYNGINRPVTPVRLHPGAAYTPGAPVYPVYPEYGYVNPYLIYPYDPFYYDPFMMNYGMTMMFSPHYNYLDQAGSGTSNPDHIENAIKGMKGYVVFQNDTLRGKVSLTDRGVSVETKDSVQDYDYVFANKKEGLKYVTIYNTDSSQLNLAKLEDYPKQMLRVVHEGKLNIYDNWHAFIYRPEDIDYRSMIVVYKGQATYLQPRSQEDAKIRLTQFVNRAYNLQLDSKDFTWKELLIYVDKMD